MQATIHRTAAKMASKRPWKQEKFATPIAGVYQITGISMAACVVFIGITSFAREPVGLLSNDCPCEGGIDQCICPRPTVEALTVFEMICLANSRVAAYVCYPLYLVLCLTMSRNLLAWLQHTILVEYLPFPTSAHHLHTWAGAIVGVALPWHALWHLIRWGTQGNLQFLVEHPTGITGLICICLTPFIVLPMQWEYLRKRISFEIRKRLHYLSWIWMGALCFHAPQRNVFWIVGTPLVIYWVDWFYGMFRATKMAPNARFVRLESAVMIRVKKPQDFQLKGAGGYCYLCVPWVSKYEWHAFSTFKDPYHEDYICFCIAVAGDWTKKLHQEVHEPIYRRLWLNGPYPSPFEASFETDNVISVASGIGITPALSAIKSLADHRKMHLIWMVRDASLLEFMFDFGIVVDDDAYTLIFYTGERELVFRRPVPYNVLIFKGRPDLDDLIVSLIEATMTGRDLDVSRYKTAHEHDSEGDVEGNSSSWTVEHDFYKEVNRLLSTYSVDELFLAAVRRSDLNSRNISYDGLKQLIQDIFVRKFSDDQLKELFDKVDQDQSGFISRNDFDGFMKDLELRSKQHYARIREERKEKARQKQPQVEKDEDDTINEAAGNITLSESGRAGSLRLPAEEEKVVQVARPDHWRLLYCGGSAPVVKALKEISAEHQIPLSLESFAW